MYYVITIDSRVEKFKILFEFLIGQPFWWSLTCFQKL